MLAFWNTKSDREQTVYPGQNRYVRDAPLSDANFECWLGVVEGLLKPGDVVAICEGERLEQQGYHPEQARGEQVDD